MMTMVFYAPILCASLIPQPLRCATASTDHQAKHAIHELGLASQVIVPVAYPVVAAEADVDWKEMGLADGCVVWKAARSHVYSVLPTTVPQPVKKPTSPQPVKKPTNPQTVKKVSLVPAPVSAAAALILAPSPGFDGIATDRPFRKRKKLSARIEARRSK